VAVKSLLYHKYDDDDYDGDDLNMSVEGRVNWAVHVTMDSKLWLQNI